jgi:hypothetical protein
VFDICLIYIAEPKKRNANFIAYQCLTDLVDDETMTGSVNSILGQHSPSAGAYLSTPAASGLAPPPRAPSDQNFVTGYNIARGEAIRAGGKELVEAGLKDRAQGVFQLRPQIPPAPLLSRKPRDGTSDRRLASKCRRKRHRWEGGNPDIGQDAQFPNHVY